jgi:protein-disulfide isomerase
MTPMPPADRTVRRILAVAPAALLLLALAACGTAAGRRTTGLRGALAQDPGIPFDDLTQAEQETLVRLLERIATPCDAVRTLAEDLLADPTVCPRSRGAARFAVRRLMDGYTPADVEAQVIQRYRGGSPAVLDVEHSPALGPAEAPVTVVVFTDFECPHCARAHRTLREIQREMPDRIRIVHKYFPSDSHPMGMSAARAAVAAERQGRFWPFCDGVFEAQDDIGPRLYVQLATELEMDIERFETDRLSEESAEAVRRDRSEAVRLGIEGTPTLYVNGRRFEDSVARLRDWILEE